MAKIIQKWNVQLVKDSSKKYDLDSKSVTSPYYGMQMFETIFKMREQPQEVFVMIALNTKNQVIGAFEVFKGSINASIVHPREVFQRLLLVNASSFMVAHNHPSGDTEPSREDIEVTNRLIEAGKLLGIQLLDHIIIGDDYCSLRESGRCNF